MPNRLYEQPEQHLTSTSEAERLAVRMVREKGVEVLAIRQWTQAWEGVPRYEIVTRREDYALAWRSGLAWRRQAASKRLDWPTT